MKNISALLNTTRHDNRNYPRTKDDCDVLIYKESQKIKAHSINLSENGMYLVTDGLLFPKDTQIKLVFSDENTQEKFVYGKVVHRTMQGIGVKFTN